MSRRILLPLAIVIGLIVLGGRFLLGAGLIRPYGVASGSMEPTLRCHGGLDCTGSDADRILALHYFGFSPQRGDVVVVQTPPVTAVVCGAGGKFVKRLIGLPGETWEERDGYVFINGRRLDEPYVPATERDARTISPNRIAPGHYFLMGDNRAASCDSRSWGAVTKKELLAKVVVTYWPPGRISIW